MHGLYTALNRFNMGAEEGEWDDARQAVFDAATELMGYTWMHGPLTDLMDGLANPSDFNVSRFLEKVNPIGGIKHRITKVVAGHVADKSLLPFDFGKMQPVPPARDMFGRKGKLGKSILSDSMEASSKAADFVYNAFDYVYNAVFNDFTTPGKRTVSRTEHKAHKFILEYGGYSSSQKVYLDTGGGRKEEFDISQMSPDEAEMWGTRMRKPDRNVVLKGFRSPVEVVYDDWNKSLGVATFDYNEISETVSDWKEQIEAMDDGSADLANLKGELKSALDPRDAERIRSQITYLEANLSRAQDYKARILNRLQTIQDKKGDFDSARDQVRGFVPKEVFKNKEMGLHDAIAWIAAVDDVEEIKGKAPKLYQEVKRLAPVYAQWTLKTGRVIRGDPEAYRKHVENLARKQILCELYNRIMHGSAGDPGIHKMFIASSPSAVKETLRRMTRGEYRPK